MGIAYSKKMRIMRLFLLFLFVLLFFQFKAQKFSIEKEKFLKQLTKEIQSESFAHFVKKEFSSFILTSQLSSQEYNDVVEVCNKMSESSFSSADYIRYIHAVYYAKKNRYSGSFVASWRSYLKEKVQGDELGDVKDFIKFSEGLFMDHALFIDNDHYWTYKGGSISWSKGRSLKLEIRNTDFKCIVYQSGPLDSIVIKNTSGYFDVDRKEWRGRGGLLTWEKVNFPKNETFAKIRGYAVNTERTILKVDTVELTTPYFEKPILGKLVDKTQFDLREGESSPIFNSFEKRLLIEGLRDQMDYDGGFTLEGANFIGRGVEGNLAKVVIHYKERPLFEIRALNFLMNPQQIIARNSNIIMHYDSGDSLYAKGALMYWNEDQKELRISAAKIGSNQVPFIDSYFKLTMNTPVLSWRLNSAFPMFTYEFGSAQEQRYAHINSWDYFDERSFDQFAGIGHVNPLMKIAELSLAKNSLELPVGSVASALRKSISQSKPQLIDISSQGFIQYSSTSDVVIVEKKLLNYALSKKGEKDFDELSFFTDLRPKKLEYSSEQISKDPYLQELEEEYKVISQRRKLQPCYAYIDIDSNEFFLNEIEQVNFSSEQKTVLFPDSSYIKVLKNRDILFSGWLKSGKLITHNIESKFFYDEFIVSLDSTDEAYLSVNPLNPSHGRGPIDMVSSLGNFKAQLHIDYPESKSGRHFDNSRFPFVDVQDSIKVFYNSKNTVGGAYDSTRFYYVLDPFILDSLDDFDERSLRMEGGLISDGIFPEINEPLKIMNDYSFGFVTQAPEEGYSFYQTESMYKNKILLSNNGLQGAGKIDFLNATALSKMLTFLPDSTIGLAEFYNAKDSVGVEFPEAYANLSEISFKPRLKVLTVKTYKDYALSMFEDQILLSGMIALSEDGITGSGRIKLLDASLESDNYEFSSSEIFSDSASFNLRNRFAKYVENPLAIQSEGLKTAISFKTRIGEFNSRGTKRIKFPSNNFYCQMDKFIWQMDGESIDFEKKKEAETKFESSAGIVKNNFFSLDEEQDSLQFKSISAQYDLKNETINCFRIDFLELGDAYIIPDGNKIHIQKDAVIDTLTNAKIIANRITRIHQFTDVTMKILGRNEFNGKGSYLYFDRDSVQTKIDIGKIYFDKIKTVANTEIKEEDQIKLSSKFDYFGNFEISSKNDGIICDGYARVNHSCEFNKSWLKFSDTVLAKNVIIPIAKNPLNKDGDELANGFLWKDSEAEDSLTVYPAFFSKKEGIEDQFLFSASGRVSYDYEKGAYLLSNNPGSASSTYSDHYLMLQDESCSLEGSGKVNLGIDLSPVSIETYGDIAYNNKERSTSLNLIAKMKIPLPKSISHYLASKLRESDTLMEYAFYKKEQERLTDVFSIFADSKEKAEKIFKDYDEDKLKKMPSYLMSTFLFPDLRLKYFMNKKIPGKNAISGLISSKSVVPIFSIEEKIVLKEVPMKIMFLQSYSKSLNQGFELRLQDPSSAVQYSFKYIMNKRNGKLFLFSNDEDYLKIILDIKEDKRKSKNFEFELGNEGMMYEMMLLNQIK